MLVFMIKTIKSISYFVGAIIALFWTTYIRSRITMKKTYLALLIAAPLAFSLTGCVVSVGHGDEDGYSINSDHENREYSNRKKIANLRFAMSYNDVQNLLGVADFNESYQKGDNHIQVLFYRTQRLHKDGLTTKDECTPLVFKKGELVSWGEQAYAQL
jgi:hypothetical protein